MFNGHSTSKVLSERYIFDCITSICFTVIACVILRLRGRGEMKLSELEMQKLDRRIPLTVTW